MKGLYKNYCFDSLHLVFIIKLGDGIQEKNANGLHIMHNTHSTPRLGGLGIGGVICAAQWDSSMQD